MNTDAIKNMLSSAGWIEMEEMIREEFLTEKKIKTEGKTDAQIASEVKGREAAAKAIDRFLRRMERIKNPIISKKESYK